MTRKNWMRLVHIMVTVAVLVVGAVYIHLNRDQLAVLAELSMGELVSLTLCIMLYFVCTGYTFYLLVSMLSVKLSPVEWIGLTFLTNAVNYLGPIRPGVVAKAAYLKQQKKMAYSRFSAILAANGFLLFLYSGIAGLALLFLIWLTAGTISYPLILVCVTLVAGAMTPFVVRFSRVERQGRVWNIVNNAIAGFEEIRVQRGKILGVGVSVIAQYLLSASCSMIAYRALGFDLDFLAALLIGVFTSISNFFTITPNNLGVQEVVIGYLSTIVGLDFSSGLISAGVIRAIHMALSFGLAPLFSHLLLKPAGLTLRSKTDIQDLEPAPTLSVQEASSIKRQTDAPTRTSDTHYDQSA